MTQIELTCADCDRKVECEKQRYDDMSTDPTCMVCQGTLYPTEDSDEEAEEDEDEEDLPCPRCKSKGATDGLSCSSDSCRYEDSQVYLCCRTA